MQLTVEAPRRRVNAAASDRLPDRARRTALAIAGALVPEGGVRIRAGGERTVARAERIVAGAGTGILPQWARLLDVAEQAARLERRGTPLSGLSPGDAADLLTRWQNGSGAVRALAYALLGPIKIAHFDDPEIYFRLECTHRYNNPEAEPAWMRRVISGTALDRDDTIECDVVVIGTGAGGGVVAKELAARGLAVLLVEEGEYNGRAQFNGSAIDGIRRLWRDRGITGTLGNAAIPVPLGRTVGGSTAINTGTCWRTPQWVLDRWVSELGLVELASDQLAPYFDRVERELQVKRADARFLGGVAKVVARGCDALGYSHRALDRNAPDCDGSGVCDFGCPTDAKRSTNVSYVPSALKSGAELRTGMRAERVLVEGDRCVGVVARSVTTGRTLEVRARATVLACGAMLTPLLLQDLGLRSRHVGRNLSIHPSTSVSALFDDSIRGYAALPQGYCVDHFHREGLLFMGASVPIDLGALQFPFAGKELLRFMDAYDRVATMGIMVEDESRGHVTRGPAGRPIVRYWLGRGERERLRRGVEILSRIFLAAGATDVITGVHGHRRMRGSADLARLRASLPAAGDFTMMAFHPVGSCRMARSEKDGVVSPDHEVFGVRDLFVADGSVVPTAPAVNPQVTIMALAARAADRIASRLEAS